MRQSLDVAVMADLGGEGMLLVAILTACICIGAYVVLHAVFRVVDEGLES